MHRRSKIVGVVGDVRRDMEGHHYAEKCSVFGISAEELKVLHRYFKRWWHWWRFAELWQFHGVCWIFWQLCCICLHDDKGTIDCEHWQTWVLAFAMKCCSNGLVTRPREFSQSTDRYQVKNDVVVLMMRKVLNYDDKLMMTRCSHLHSLWWIFLPRTLDTWYNTFLNISIFIHWQRHIYALSRFYITPSN